MGVGSGLVRWLEHPELGWDLGHVGGRWFQGDAVNLVADRWLPKVKATAKASKGLGLGIFPYELVHESFCDLGVDGFHGREIDLAVVGGRWLARLGSDVLGDEGGCDQMMSSSANSSLTGNPLQVGKVRES